MNPDNGIDNYEQPRCAAVDDEAYEPTYAEAFPPLPVPVAETGDVIQEPVPSQWGSSSNKMALQSSITTQVFTVPVEERKYKEMSEQQFGEQRSREQTKICQDIMSKTGVAIEMSLARDQSLTFVITGKKDAVMKARKLIIQQLQTQGQYAIKIPKDHHRFILGPKGRMLSELELNTATKISIPRQEDPSDIITITGTKDGIEKARHEIQLISDEQAKLAFVRLPVPKIYHPFICGPFNQTIKELMDSTGARINIPPLFVAKDELTIAGEKDGVHLAEQAIRRIVDAKVKTCTTVAVEVKKSQHKYVIGPKGQNLSEILAETGVSVEVPPLDSPTDTITLRGEADKLGIALTAVYAKANSVMTKEVLADSWLHRFIIGPKGTNIKKITQDFPRVHIEFVDDQNKIVLEGPPEEVEKVASNINEQKLDLMSRMAFVDLKIDPKYHRHIIGRNGANVTRIKNETGVSIRIPQDSESNGVIRIEGTPEGVAVAKQELIEMVEKMDNEKSKDILIDHRFHKAIIGAQGAKIREIREQFNNVQISFPDPAKQSDVVTLRGPKDDVDKCYKYLQKIANDMSASSYEEKIHIFKDAHAKIIGKGGAQIRKIREETDTKIEMPRENSDSDVITITGKKENVLKAKNMIEAIQKEAINIVEITVDIPHKFHTSMIGTKGQLIREIADECGGVQIRFPSENTNSDKVFVRGSKEFVEKAKKRLQDLANDRKESGYTAQVRCKPEYHGFLIGRGGASIREFRERTGTRVMFPGANDANQELITIVGKKEDVDKAEHELKERIAGLENTVEEEVHVDPAYHLHFTARRGDVLKQIADECGGVTTSFPRPASKSDRVVLKGAKECVDAAIKRIEEIVADLKAQVTVECIIPRKFHGNIMGAKGHRIQEISKVHNVTIKIPERTPDEKEQQGQRSGSGEHVPNGENVEVSGNGESTPPDLESDGDQTKQRQPANKRDIILITGKPENCEAAKEAMLALVPVTVEMEVPFELHGQLIGQKGKEIRQIMEECDVTISVPRPGDNSDTIKITGVPTKIPHAQEVIQKKIKALEDERAQRELRSFRLEVPVLAKHHTKLIGKRGAVVNKIRADFDVQINFPDKASDQPDTIVIIGLEEKTMKARDDILKKVQEMEEMVSEEVRIDPRVHSRLIGARGRSIAKIMDQFHVDVRMPGRDAKEPDLVVITGHEDDVYDCREHMLNLEEEYLQDVRDSDTQQHIQNLESHAAGLQLYSGPADSSQQSTGGGGQKGFVVRDAPWSQSYTHNADDFPDLGASNASRPSPVAAATAPSRPVWPISRR